MGGKPSLENPAVGVHGHAVGRQHVSWDGVTPESDRPYDPEKDGYADGGFPVGH